MMLRSLRLVSVLRFALRAVSLAVLTAAVGLVVADAARSIAAQAWVPTPLRQSWEGVWPEGLRAFLAWTETALPASIRTGVVRPLLGFPAWAVLAGLALLLGIGGYRPETAEVRRPAGTPE